MCNQVPVQNQRGLSDIRKSKYGDVHRQLRALTILDGLIQNAGSRFQRAFADEPLLERLRVAATDSFSDQEVKQKCGVLFRQWAVSYKSTPGLERIASLYKQLPQRKKPVRQDQSKVLRETEQEAEAEASPTSPTVPSSSIPSIAPVLPGPKVTPVYKYDVNGKKIKKQPEKTKTEQAGPEKVAKTSKSAKLFNLEKEKPQLLQTIASSSVASTNLTNALRLVNRESKRVSEDPETVKRFETCKVLRRQVLRYIQSVENSEEWLGSLIHANDELVNALRAYEVLDKSVDDDSDSEDDSLQIDAANHSKGNGLTQLHQDLSSLHLGGSQAPQQPPRPGFIQMPSANGKQKADDEGEEEEEEDDDIEDEDENDPFADRNAVQTPRVEKSAMAW